MAALTHRQVFTLRQNPAKVEWRLRYAQGHDALRSLRSCLRAQTAILKYKDQNLRGQGANTRARNTLKAIDVRIEAASRRYESAHKALVILGSLLDESGWQSALRPLNHQDIRSMSDLLWGESEGRRKLSWIWNMQGAGGSEKDDNGALEGEHCPGMSFFPNKATYRHENRVVQSKSSCNAMGGGGGTPS
jgi:hypothetical protein